jgi:hypothetical protein
MSPHRSCGTDQNLPTKVVAAVAVDGMFVGLDRIVMSSASQMLPQGGFGNAAAITVMESLHEQYQSEERCIVASFSRDVADTLLTGQHCCMHYMPVVLLVTRCNDGPLQASFRVPHKMKLVVVRSMLGSNTSYVSAEMVVSAVCPGEDSVGVALLGILVTACIVAEQDRAQNAVIPGRLKIVARWTLLGVADWAGCACSRFGSNKFEEQRWVTQCNLGHAAAGGSACHSFREPHYRDAVTPWCHEAGVDLLQYGERFTEPITSEFGAAITAVDHEANSSVTGRLEGSGRGVGTGAVTLQVHSIADTLPAGLVAGTAGLACCAKDSRRLPCGGFLRHPPDTKSAPLLDDICTVRRWGLDTGDLKVPSLPAQTVALSAVRSLSPELSRHASLPNFDAPSPAPVSMVPSHRALLTHQSIRSAGYTATWDAQFRLGGTCEPASQITPHSCVVAFNRVSALMPTLHMAVACRLGRDVRTVGIVNKRVGALAVLNHDGKFSVACIHRLSDHRPGIYVVTFYIGTVDNALWVMQNAHLPRAGSLRRISDAMLALLSNVFSVQWRLGRYTSNFSLAGIRRFTASLPAACKNCVVFPYLERCGLASQPGVAACLCRNAGSLAGQAAGTHDGYFLANVTMSDSPVGDNAARQYPLRMDTVTVNPVRADTTANHQPVAVLTHPGSFSVVCTTVTNRGRSFLGALATLLTITAACVRVIRRGPVQVLVRVHYATHGRCGVMKLALYMWMLCGVSLVRARSDVDFTTWNRPAQGLEVLGEASYDAAGYSVSDAGDVNKDGFQDVLVGAHLADLPGKVDAGAVYLVFGSPGRSIVAIDTAVAPPPKGIKISGATAGDSWGISVSGAGDVNMDGVDDFIIGGPYFDSPSRTGAGAAVVIFGKTSGWADIDLATFTSGSAGFWVYGAAAGDQLGWAVSDAGDVNGDGADDVIVGAQLADSLSRTDSGTAYVIFGHGNATAFTTVDLANFVSGNGGFRLFGAVGGDKVGYDVCGARDINGDGFSDIIVGAPTYDAPGRLNSGAAYVIFGHSNATAFTDIDLAILSSSQGFRILGSAAGHQLGYSMSSAGDFNHDGYDDVVVGSQAGKAYVVFGHSNTTAFPSIDLTGFVAGISGFVVTGSGSLGGNVCGGVDVNGDGVDDVVLVAPYQPTGVAYVLYGRSQLLFTDINVLSDLPVVRGYRIIASGNGGSGGWFVSLVRDFDGDGVGDVLVGLRDAVHSGRYYAGVAYLIYGELSAPTSQPTSQPSRQPSARPTSSPVSERSGDVDLATWSKPREGLEGWGALAGDNSGSSVADAGDVNKDGYQDILVGAYRTDLPGKADAGAVYLVFGSPGRSTNTIDTAAAMLPKGIKISGVNAGDYWGISVSGAGDVNQDGIDDFIIGGYQFDPSSRTDAGAAVVIFGKTNDWADIDLASFTSGSAGFWIYGAATGDMCGKAVNCAGDVNGDGAADLIVGCDWADPLAKPQAGTSYVIFGHNTAFTTIDLSFFNTGAAGFRIFGAAVEDYSGNSVSGAGDVDGDGYGDIIVGAPYYDGPSGRTDSGAAYVIFGHSGATAFTDIDLATLSSSQGFGVTGATASSYLGRPVSCAGDINHDGYGDVIIGTSANKAYIILGHFSRAMFTNLDLNTFTAGTVGFAVSGTGDFGNRVSGGGDVNGDGVDDVVIAAPTYSSTGAAFIVYGRFHGAFTDINVLTGLPTVDGFKIVGVSSTAGDWRVALVRDFDGDGVGDVLLGTQFADPSGRIDAGAAYLVYGELSAPTSQPSRQPTGQPSRQPTRQPSQHPSSQPSRLPSRQPTTQPSRQPTSQPSRQPSTRPTSSPVSERSGDVDLETWSKPGQGLEVVGASVSYRLGRAVGSGDFNKDGYQDLLIGAYFADVLGRTEAGAVYLVFGSASRSLSTIDTANAITTTGVKILGAAADWWGWSVSGAGDFNKDGIDDILIGAIQFDPPSRGAGGGAVVIFGKTSGWADIDLASFTSGSAGFWIHGAAEGDHGGGSVSGAGDVNGDGIGDVLFGAQGHDPPGRMDAGAAYVIFGHATGPFNTVNLTSFTSGSAGFKIIGAIAADHTGEWVARAGDINGDGFDDIFTASMYYDRAGGTDCGAVYVIFGHSATTAFTDIDLAILSSSQGFRITGATANDRLGWSVSTAGDFNHDGYEDVVIGTKAGKAYVLLSHSNAGITANLDLATFSAGSGGFVVIGSGDFGTSVSGGDDINRDGAEDIIIADPSGVAYVLYGRRQLVFADINVLSGLPSASGYRIIGAAVSVSWEWSVSLVGDFDADGVGDIVVGTPFADPAGRSDAGIAYLVYGELSAPTSQPSRQPTGLPSRQPTSQPSRLPSTQPSRQPSTQPTSQPSSRPTTQPTGRPSGQPTTQPSGQPTSAPTRQPTAQPSRQPSSQPTRLPTAQPSGKPSSQPTAQPSSPPSAQPSTQPTQQPTMQPSRCPSGQPSRHPTAQPSTQPNSTPSAQPSSQPSVTPSAQPSPQPSSPPSRQPTASPSSQPSKHPNAQPSCSPTCQPSPQPTAVPSTRPTRQPTSAPSDQPISGPSAQPTKQPTAQPSYVPSSQPSAQPTHQPAGNPSGTPSCQPSSCPTTQPTKQPSGAPSSQPSLLPSVQPSCAPSCQPTACPSGKPSCQPSSRPSAQPSQLPTGQPSCAPTRQPTALPSTQPTGQPTLQPTGVPSAQPSKQPTGQPSGSPTTQPTTQPSARPSPVPTAQPSSKPTGQPSAQPSHQPSAQPTQIPTAQPSCLPSGQPTGQPSTQPSRVPSRQPTGQPTVAPSRQPTAQPTSQPSCAPSIQPSRQPTCKPSTQPSSAPTKVVVSSASLGCSVSVLATGRTFAAVEVNLHGARDGDVRLYAVVKVGGRSQPADAIAVALQLATDDTAQIVGQKPAALNVSSLLPSTTYDLYCAATSSQGVTMPLSSILTTKQPLRTACCKLITVAVQHPATVNVGQDLARAVTLVLDAPPSASVAITLQYAGHDQSSAGVQLLPSALRYDNRSAVGISKDVRLTALGAGNYTLVVSVTGSSADEYRVVYAGARRLTVLSADTTPAVPQLMQASFSNDGSYVVLSFDSATDRGGLYGTFPCRTLLRCAGDSSAQCQWSSDSQLRIYPAAARTSSVLSVGGNVTLLANVARAKCTAADRAVGMCATYVPVASTAVLVAAPGAPTTPTVVIAAPSAIGGCNSLTVDLAGSVGAAGRFWDSVSFAVSTTPASTSAAAQILQFLSRNYTLSPPLPVPSAVLVKGYTYSIKVTLCNFLKACGSATKVLSVAESIAPVPVVTIAGQSVRTVYRADLLSVVADAYTQSCNGGKSSMGLQYSWAATQLLPGTTSFANATLRSTSQNPTVFKLPAYTLTVGATYTLTVTALSTASGQRSSAAVQLKVLQSDLVAVLKGGSTRYAMVGEAVTLDASGSYDKDYPQQSLTGATVIFSWQCLTVAPVLSAACAITLLEANPGRSSVINVTSTYTALNTTTVVSVTVSDASRSSIAQARIIILRAPSPRLSISAVGSTDNVNTGKPFTLLGSLYLLAPCTAAWSVDDPTIALTAAARTSVQQFMLPATGATAVPFNLVIKSDALPQRATLLFSLSCSSTTVSTTVTTNGAPLPGSFSVKPAYGIELSTTFTFAAAQWTDPDLPLTYQFGFQSAVSLFNLVIVSRSELSYATSSLPAGDTSRASAVDCSLRIYDNLGAFADRAAVVLVTTQDDADQASQLVLELLRSSSDSVQGMKTALAVGSSVINAVNCTAAPDCAVLNRRSCRMTSGQCGACLDGFAGDAGDRNTLCVALTAPPVQLTTTKGCAFNCTGHGQCIFVSKVTGSPVAKCTLADTDCDATCACVDNYSGEFCEIDPVTLRRRREVRSNLILSLSNLTAQEDINTESVAAWSANLYALSIRPHEVSQSDAAVLADIANTTLHHAIAQEVDSFADMQGVLQATDAVASLLRYNYNPNDYRDADFNTSRSYVNNTAARFLPVVSTFGDMVSKLMVLGENETTLVYDNFRMTVALAVGSRVQEIYSVPTGEQQGAAANRQWSFRL